MTRISPKPDIEVSRWIARSPEDIWDYLLDVPNELLWRSGVISAQWVSDPPHGIGSTGLHVVERIGDYPWKVTEWEEPYNMSWDVTGGRMAGWYAGYRLTPENDGSLMTIHAQMNPGAFKIIRLLIMKGLITRQLTGDLEMLKAIMEA